MSDERFVLLHFEYGAYCGLKDLVVGIINIEQLKIIMNNCAIDDDEWIDKSFYKFAKYNPWGDGCSIAGKIMLTDYSGTPRQKEYEKLKKQYIKSSILFNNLTHKLFNITKSNDFTKEKHVGFCVECPIYKTHKFIRNWHSTCAICI